MSQSRDAFITIREEGRQVGGGREGEIYPGECYHVTNIRKSVKEIKRYVTKQVHEIIYQLYREEDINMKKWNSWLYHIIIFFCSFIIIIFFFFLAFSLYFFVNLSLRGFILI